jgi:hypothetical protein
VDYGKDSTWIAWNQAALLRVWGKGNETATVKMSNIGLQLPSSNKHQQQTFSAPKEETNWKLFVQPIKKPYLQWNAGKSPKVPDSPSITDEMEDPYDLDTMLDSQNDLMEFEPPMWRVNPPVSLFVARSR